MKTINGAPVYSVNFSDFSYLVSLYKSGKRFLTRNLENDELIDYVKKSRSRDFYIEYQGVLVDFRTYLPSNQQECN